MQAAGGWAAALSSGAWRDAAVAAVASIIAMVLQGLVFMTSLALTIGAVRLARRRVLVQELSAVEGLARVDMLCVDKTGTLPDATVPFSSRYKWSAAYFREGESPETWVLGGADVVLSGTAAGAAEMQRQVTRLASAGRRTVVLAHSPYLLTSTVPTVAPALPKGLEPVAVVVLRERVRADAAETIGYFGSQGVQVCVISGDDPLTVGAVAHEIGLPAGLVAADARSLPTDPVALAEVLRTERVFGRVTPQQKKAMVLALQSLGYTVAMTGDGVNDTLALKHADLGIAMGSGSAAARAVAQIVLLDGEFALARQLSIVDGISIGLPALVLALLPNERKYRPGFIKRAARFCVPSGLVVAIAVIGVVTYASIGVGATQAVVQTTAVVTLTLSALWILMILARPFTRATTMIVIGAYASLVVVVVLPLTTDFLRLTMPSPELLFVALGASAVASLTLELLHRRATHRPDDRSVDPAGAVLRRTRR
ncbi:hypothetical protein B7R21_15765 [Subtercola boreus]|uniref:Uncharacterized protein n=1 Tax=Subtercola boreus TaxID=120213 RepID=A0A3E0VD12_9MICO|nr:HAD-IC family P-type ATPase [Subtercola boreus]RFA07631.1 hypothetical protein B7R21_15765 [Subtercola boreus]